MRRLAGRPRRAPSPAPGDETSAGRKHVRPPDIGVAARSRAAIVRQPDTRPPPGHVRHWAAARTLRFTRLEAATRLPLADAGTNGGRRGTELADVTPAHEESQSPRRRRRDAD